jgi:hypothetical protein
MPLATGDQMTAEIVGLWGGALGQEIQSLPAAYTRAAGIKALRNTGIAEYAFSGEILESRSLEDYGAPGVRYQEMLVDCGVPLILVTRGVSPPRVYSLDAAVLDEPKPGDHISGIAILDARVSSRYPHLVERQIVASVVALEELLVLPHTGRLGETRPCRSSAERRKGMPLLVTMEV